MHIGFHVQYRFSAAVTLLASRIGYHNGRLEAAVMNFIKIAIFAFLCIWPIKVKLFAL
jgi:hypothetical protein